MTEITNIEIKMPHTPSMSLYESRLNSFSNWNINIKATPQELARAGFFYTGKRDAVRCFNCDGVLQNFEFNDDAWFEHAKWFPRCEFLLQQKGCLFVDHITKEHPNLKLSNPTRKQSRSLCNVDIEEYKSVLAARTNSAMGSLVIKEGLKFGFEEPLVKKLVKMKLQHESCEYNSVENLISDLQKLEKSPNNIYSCRLPQLHRKTNNNNTAENSNISAGRLLMTFSTNTAS